MSPTGFFTRDPIGYLAGLNQYQLMSSTALKAVDPSGLFEAVDSRPPRECSYSFWAVEYYKVFGNFPQKTHSAGCIGLVRDCLGKDDMLFDDNTDCFTFKGDIGRTKSAADKAFQDKKCPCDQYPAMFAYRYQSGPRSPESCPKCGHVSDPHVPNPVIDPSGTPGSPAFDFCFRFNDYNWGGANNGSEGDNPKPQKILVWPSIEDFDAAYPKTYDTTVICVTCTGDRYPQSYSGGFHHHHGPLRPGQRPKLQGIF